VEAAIQQRDSDIRAYHQKRSLALTREICGLKVAHQQLIAAHAAAKKLAGAASLQGATLRQQLQVGWTVINISSPCCLIWPWFSIRQNVAQLHSQLCKMSSAHVTTCYHVHMVTIFPNMGASVLMINWTSWTLWLLQALEERQSALHEARNSAQDDQQPAADASAQLASKAHEIYRLQEDLLQHRQKLANQEISVQELHAAMQSSKNKARQAEEDGHR